MIRAERIKRIKRKISTEKEAAKNERRLRHRYFAAFFGMGLGSGQRMEPVRRAVNHSTGSRVTAARMLINLGKVSGSPKTKLSFFSMWVMFPAVKR